MHLGEHRVEHLDWRDERIRIGDGQFIEPYALAFAASSFIYVAVADLIPGLHRRVDPRAGLEQVLFIGLGVALVYFTHQQMH